MKHSGRLELFGDLLDAASAFQAQGELAAYPRLTPMLGSISHQAPESISIAERASTVGPIAGIWVPST